MECLWILALNIRRGSRVIISNVAKHFSRIKLALFSSNRVTKRQRSWSKFRAITKDINKSRTARTLERKNSFRIAVVRYLARVGNAHCLVRNGHVVYLQRKTTRFSVRPGKNRRRGEKEREDRSTAPGDHICGPRIRPHVERIFAQSKKKSRRVRLITAIVKDFKTKKKSWLPSLISFIKNIFPYFMNNLKDFISRSNMAAVSE